MTELALPEQEGALPVLMDTEPVMMKAVPVNGAIYRLLAHQMRLACAERPFLKRSVVALEVGARIFQVIVADLKSTSRRREVCEARQKTMVVAHLALGCSLNQIAGAFRRDHTTVSHAIQKYGDEVKEALGL